MRTKQVAAIMIAAVLAVVLAGCGLLGGGSSDSQLAAKYKAAVESLTHVASVESSYKTAAGMGRTADVFIYADTDDEAELTALFASAFPKIIQAADGDPQVSLYIQVISADNNLTVGPESVGYDGTGTLSSYREFLRDHPIP
jgi:hypothetical protein